MYRFSLVFSVTVEKYEIPNPKYSYNSSIVTLSFV